MRELELYFEDSTGATISSYKICWTQAKNTRPYSDAEIVKTCMVDA